jgi:hypothetical protein
MAQIVNTGRAWIQHGDDEIYVTNPQTVANFQITTTIHLPILATGDVTTRGPAHSTPTPPTLATGTAINVTARADIDTDASGNSFYGMHIRLNGGFGFTFGGFNGVSIDASVERYDDVAQTQTVPVTLFASDRSSAFSLNGFGYFCGGENPSLTAIGTVTRWDDPGFAFSVRTPMNTPRGDAAPFTINGKGFICCGFDSVNKTTVTERFDDVANAWTTRAPSTGIPRDLLAGFGTQGFGFTAGGEAAGGGTLSFIPRFNDSTNVWVITTGSLTAFRRSLAGFGMNGYGFAVGGEEPIGTNKNNVDRFDNLNGTDTARNVLSTARRQLAGYSLNGFGFASGGIVVAVSGITERLDDVADSRTVVTTLSVPRSGLAGYATNEYFVNYDTMEQ